MGLYHELLITEITQNIDPRLIAAFNLKHEQWKIPFSDIEGLVSHLMDTQFKGKMYNQDLLEIGRKNQRYRSRRKSDWCASFQNDIAIMKIEDKKHPFNFLLTSIKTMTPDMFHALYGNQATYASVIEDAIRSVESWKSNTKSNLIDYPAFESLTPLSRQKAFYLDMVHSIWSYIQKRYKGNIASFVLYGVGQDLHNAAISPSSFKMPVVEDNSTYQYEIDDDEGHSILQLSILKDIFPAEPKSLDKADLRILTDILSDMKITGLDPVNEKSVTLAVYDLACAAANYDYNPGPARYKRVKESLKKWLAFHFGNSDKEGYNVLDSYIFSDDENNVKVTITDNFYKRLINTKLMPIVKSQFYSLEEHLSQNIAFALKQEQISHSSTLSGVYTYRWFCSLVFFSNKNRANHIFLIKKSLQEFVDKGIILQSFNYANDAFILNFLPLTEYEKTQLDCRDDTVNS